MTRLEAFKRTAMGATVAAALAAVIAPAAAQSASPSRASALAEREARLQARDQFREQRRRDVTAMRDSMRKMDRHSRALEEVAERVERRALEIEWLMDSYRAMNDEIGWALRDAGGTLSAEDSLGIAANVIEKHIGAIEASGITAFPADGNGLPDRILMPATPRGAEASGFGFLDDLQARIEGLADEIAMRSIEVYAEEGRAASASASLGAVMDFAAGAGEDAGNAADHLERFSEAVEAPSFR